MLKITGSSNKPASSRNNSNKLAFSKNNNSRLVSGKNNSNGEVNRFGISGNSMEYAKKSEKNCLS